MRGHESMDEDEFLPPRKETLEKNLDAMSIEELERYIADLRAEIARTEATIEARRQVRSGADAVFKKS